MKTNKKNDSQKLENFAKSLTENELLFAIYKNKKTGDVGLTLPNKGDDENDIVALVAAMIVMSFKGKGDCGMDGLSDIFLKTIRTICCVSSDAGVRLAVEMANGAVDNINAIIEDELAPKHETRARNGRKRNTRK